MPAKPQPLDYAPKSKPKTLSPLWEIILIAAILVVLTLILLPDVH
jgi:hypothetical protein